MSESVFRNGQVLYAPLIACRPVRPEDYPPARLKLHRTAEANLGQALNIYPGSVYGSCEDCEIQVAVGPRQQDMIAAAKAVGLAAHVVCLLDASIRVSEANEEDVDVLSLGNPFRRQEK